MMTLAMIPSREELNKMSIEELIELNSTCFNKKHEAEAVGDEMEAYFFTRYGSAVSTVLTGKRLVRSWMSEK